MENKNVESNGRSDFFGEPISVYADEQAVEDGVLCDLKDLGVDVRFLGLPINRMTGHLFADLKPFIDADTPLFGGDSRKALASILCTKCKYAHGSEGNTGEIGDIYKLPPDLWLVRNEVGGWTAMYPEDY